MKNKSEVTGIIVEYADGTTRRVEKGLCWTFSEKADSCFTLTADMVNMSGRDMYDVVTAAIQFGDMLGLFERSSSE